MRITGLKFMSANSSYYEKNKSNSLDKKQVSNNSNSNPGFGIKVSTDPALSEKVYKLIQEEVLDKFFGKGVEKISVEEYITRCYEGNSFFKGVFDISSLKKRLKRLEAKQEIILNAILDEDEKANPKLKKPMERAYGIWENLIIEIERGKVNLTMILSSQKRGVLLRSEVFNRMKENHQKAIQIQRNTDRRSISAATKERNELLKSGGHLN